LSGERFTFTGNGPTECIENCDLWIFCEIIACKVMPDAMEGRLSNATGDLWHWGGNFSGQ
jgi:hypothetical protein